MKKILLISEQLNGAIVLLYSAMGERGLMKVDFTECSATERQKAYILQIVPLTYGADFEKPFAAARLRVVVEDAEPEFDVDFWDAYGKKINQARCVKLWGNLTKADRAAACMRLPAYLRYLSQHQWRSKMDPESYLRQKAWLTDWDNAD